ncbi:MAG: class I SAM-dependent methyltransferase [Arenicellales bacterium]|nr:class I SAM-dependent methyltransferase [Arenicellales bacterium]
MNLIKSIVRRSFNWIQIDPNLAARKLPGIYYRSCNFCGCKDMVPFEFLYSKKPRIPPRFPFKIYGDSGLSNPLSTRFLALQYLCCRDCGLSFINPLPKFSDINRHSFDGERNIVAWKDEDWKEYVADKLRFIETYYEEVGLENTRSSGRVLDVSCGPGVTIDWLKKEKGWNVTGIDPDLYSQRQARKLFGLDIQNGLIEDLEAPEECFDWIIMDNSLEHHFDPLSALLCAFRFLRKGGYLCIIVPNADGLSTLYHEGNMYWGHWFAYTPKTLGLKLADIGYQMHGLIADQGGLPPEKLRQGQVALSREQLDQLAVREFGSNTLDYLKNHRCYADYFSLIATKPSDAAVASPQEETLREIAQQSTRERIENHR